MFDNGHILAQTFSKESTFHTCPCDDQFSQNPNVEDSMIIAPLALPREGILGKMASYAVKHIRIKNLLKNMIYSGLELLDEF